MGVARRAPRRRAASNRAPSAARLLAVAISLVALGHAGGCGGKEEGGVAQGGGARPGTGGSGHGGAGGTAGSTTDSGAGAFGGGLRLDSGLGKDMGLTADSSCASETQQAERIVVAMYIVLDASGSMNRGTPSRWSQATQALTTFGNDPMSAGLKVAIQSFGGEGPCDGSVYNTPAVAMGELPANTPNIIGWMSGVIPNGNTPTQGALLGLTSYTGTYAMMHPDEKTVGLLVTDGMPTRCDQSAGTLAGIAQAAFNNGILIFTMGMQGADFALLNQVAAGGGTMTAFDASSGPDAFLQALETIRGVALQCEYSMPESTTGDTVDPNQINVEFTPSGLVDGGTDKQLIGKVADEAACAGHPWAWYYDDNASPTKILLCPDTCKNAQKDPQGQVSIILGCTSLPPV